MAELTARSREDKALLGIQLMLVAWLFLAVVDTSVKWLVIAGLPALQLSFMRYFVHFLMSWGMLARNGSGSVRLPSRHAGLVWLRAALLVSATLTNFYALNFLSLTVTSSIMFSSPIIVSALSGPLLGERVGPGRWLAILLGFAGVLIIIRPLGAEFHWATILVVYNAFALAFFSILTRRLSGAVHTETMQFCVGVLGAVVLFPAALWCWQSPDTALGWVLLIGVGFWGWAGHELFSRAHVYGQSSALMPYSYSFIIYLAITSYLVFGEIPDGYTVLGAAIIVISGLLIWKRERMRKGVKQ